LTIFHFKPVDATSSTWKFGISDHTLVVLATSLLDDERYESATPLAEAMVRDPAFTIWAAAEMARRDAPFDTIRKLAGLVAPLLPSLLQNACSCAEEMDTEGCSSPNASLHVIVQAEIARFLLTSEPPSPCDDPVYLAAILNAALQLTGSTPNEAAFLTVPLTEAEKTVVEESGRLLQGHRLPKKIGDLDERLLGVDDLLGPNWIEQRRQHLEQKIPEAENLFKKLLARLDHIRQIETAFHETLEQEKLEAMAEFAAGAGHEINNPIAVIAGRAQLMLQDETDPERARSLALINAQAKRVYEMIADMRLFARPPEPTFEQIDLISLIDETLDEMAEAAEAQATTLRRTGDRRAILLDADPTQLAILLRVMIQNSLEAIGSGGAIEIEADEEEKGDILLLPERPEGCATQKLNVPFFSGQETAEKENMEENKEPEKGTGTFSVKKSQSPFPCVTLRITDDGPGISDEVRRHLFDPYYSGRQAGRGLGLGLSKAWRIVVTNHHGTIQTDSHPAQGTTFTIRLPKQQS
jgi:signal transduction histidine kinase